MATEVTLPALGESVTEGTVTRWLKQVGDSVSVDEALLEVSTDKVDTEIPSPVAGTLLEIKAAEDETVEVGAVLAVIGAEGESSGDGGDSGEAQASDQEDEESSGAEDEGDEEAEEQAESGTQEQEQQPEQAEEPSQPEQPAAQEQTSGGGGDSSGGGKTTSVTLPALGESVTEGTVTRWLKQVGDEVAVDEALLEVSTDKVDTEIPSPTAGTLLEIKVNEDETVEVGAELAVIGEKGAAPSGGGDEQPAQEQPAEEQPAQAEEEPAPEQASSRSRRSSPAAGRAARATRPARAAGRRDAGPFGAGDRP